jgi:Putative motility protein
MDVTTAASLGSQVALMKTGDAVGITVLRKAIDLQAQGALQLLDALPPVASNPPHLGNSIDVKA